MLKTFWRIKGEAVARRAATGRVFAELAPSERFPACYFCR